jgi:protocatechuate 3,4-dioxygenase beta subunit
MVLRGIRNPLDRELVLVDFKPIKDSKIGELSAQFDIVLGTTPLDRPRDGR